MFGWSFFWITNAHTLLRFWKAMAGGYGLTGASTMWELTAWEYWPMLIVCIAASTPIASWTKFRLSAWIEGRSPGKFSEQGIANPRCIQTDDLNTFDAMPCNKKRKAAYAIFMRFTISPSYIK